MTEILKEETAEPVSEPIIPVISDVVVEAVENTNEIVSEADKAPAKTISQPIAGWAKNWYSNNPNYLQSSHQTKEERFPLIFDSAKSLKPDAKRILSFGCSTGEECQALGKRFPESEIIGLDIDHYTIQTARKKNKSSKIFFHDELGGTGKYDLVLALMVFFCMEEPIPKDRFISSLLKIDQHLNNDGVLIIYTSDYDPKEILGDSYTNLKVWMREHNKNNKLYFNGYYQKVKELVYELPKIEEAKPNEQ